MQYKPTVNLLFRSITFVAIVMLIVSCANPIPAQSTTITFAANTFIKSFYPSLASLTDEFHKQNPTITVQVVNPPEDDWTKSDLSTLASTADTTLLSPSLERLAGNATYFKDLSPLINSDSAFKSEDFWPGLLTACQDAQGKTVGLPMGVYEIGIFYDPRRFDAAGLAYPVPGWTWDDFRKDVTTLASKTDGQVAYGFVDATGFLVSLLAPTVDSLLESAYGKVDPAALAGQMQWYLDLAKTGSVFSFDQSSDNRLALFKDNVQSMWIGGLNDSSPMDVSQLARHSYGFVPFPIAADGSMGHTSTQFTVCGVINSGTPHPQETWAWLDFLTHQKPESTAPNAVISQIPSRQSVADSSQYWESFTSQAAIAVKYGLGHGWYGSFYPQTLSQVGDSFARVLTGKVDLVMALAQAAASPGQPTPTPGLVAAMATHVPTQSTSDGIVTITYVAPSMPPGDTTFDKLAEAFHRLHPSIIVNVINNDWGCGHGSFADCLKLNPDVFTAKYEYGDISKDSDYVLSLDSFLEGDDPTIRNDFYPGLLDTFSYNGKLYGFPAAAGIPLLYYNKNLLAAKGLTPPTTRWTVDEFLAMAKAVSSGGGPGIWTKDTFKAETNGTLSPQIFGATNVDLQILNFQAQGWIDSSVEPPAVNLNQPQVLSALKKLSDLIKQGVILYSNNLSFLGLQDVILSGRVAFWFDDSDITAGGFSQFDSNTIQVGVAPIPQGLDAYSNLVDVFPGMVRALKGHFISKDTKYPQACWQWISFISADSTSFYGAPVRRSIAASANWEARVGTQTAAVYRAALAQVSPYQQNPDTNTDYWAAYGYELPFFLYKVLGKVVAGADPQATIIEEQRAIDTYLACIAPLNLAPSGGTTANANDQITGCAQKADPWSDLIYDWP